MQSIQTPLEIVKVEIMGPHFTKFHLGNNQVLHHFTEANDIYFHDHPWPFTSSILIGGYVEEVATITEDGQLVTSFITRMAGTTHDVASGAIHRIVALMGTECLTLVNAGEEDRKTGFYRADFAGVWHRFWDQAHWTLVLPTVKLL